MGNDRPGAGDRAGRGGLGASRHLSVVVFLETMHNNPRKATSGHPGRMRDWDATTYDRVADPQAEWGREVLERLDLGGDEAVLDVGCGSGRVTKLLLDRLPRGRGIGVGASTSVDDKARGRLGTARAEL